MAIWLLTVLGELLLDDAVIDTGSSVLGILLRFVLRSRGFRNLFSLKHRFRRFFLLDLLKKVLLHLLLSNFFTFRIQKLGNTTVFFISIDIHLSLQSSYFGLLSVSLLFFFLPILFVLLFLSTYPNLQLRVVLPILVFFKLFLSFVPLLLLRVLFAFVFSHFLVNDLFEIVLH